MTTLPRMMARAEGGTRRRFEVVYEAFGAGAAMATDDIDLDGLRDRPPFAFEGLGHALALRAPERLASLWPALRPPERTLVAIGVGMANEERRREVAVPAAHRGDAVDGRGFQRALFHGYALRHPRRFRHSAQRAFDRGVGRGAYFALGARPDLLMTTLARFPEGRRDAVWLGVGVALAFTGGVTAGARRSLEDAGGAPLRAGLERGTALRAALTQNITP